MDHLKAMKIFIEVSEQGGFAPAARVLNLSTSAASRYIADLEGWLGAQLFHRTTRQLNLTADGKGLLAQCKRILGEVDELKRSVSRTRSEPQGQLRVSMPVFLSKHWAGDVITSYIREYPKVNLDLVIVDRFVNLVEEGFDLVLRAGQLEDSTLISRKLSTVRLKLVASPGYLKSNGWPSSPGDLRNHRCIIDTIPSYGDRWPIGDGASARHLQGHRTLRVNSGEIARDMAIAGLGITLLPDFIVEEAVRESRLATLMDEIIPYEAGIFAVYPQSQYVSTNVRNLIDFLVAHKSVPQLGPGQPASS